MDSTAGAVGLTPCVFTMRSYVLEQCELALPRLCRFRAKAMTAVGRCSSFIRYWLASLTSFMADRIASFRSDVGRFSALSSCKTNEAVSDAGAAYTSHNLVPLCACQVALEHHGEGMARMRRCSSARGSTGPFHELSSMPVNETPLHSSW